MKPINQFWVPVFLLLVACQDQAIEEVTENQEKHSAQSTSCLTFFVGDKDGFGIGLKLNDSFVVEAGKALPIDYREADDLFFTDIYPAWLGSTSNEPVISYELTFDKPVKVIATANLNMLTLGIQDGDTQVYNSDTDIKLFMDDIEISYAFDKVDQFELRNGVWSGFVGLVEIEIPEELLKLLNDGGIRIRLEVHQLNKATESIDAFAIDYCELILCFDGAEY